MPCCSLTSVLGVGVMPLMSRTFYSNLLTCLIGLAVGSLAGSAVFHLIPSAFRSDLSPMCGNIWEPTPLLPLENLQKKPLFWLTLTVEYAQRKAIITMSIL